MADKGLAALVKESFGIGGIIIISFAWVRVGTIPDKILVTLIGLIGIIVSLYGVIPFKQIMYKLLGIRNTSQISNRGIDTRV